MTLPIALINENTLKLPSTVSYEHIGTHDLSISNVATSDTLHTRILHATHLASTCTTQYPHTLINVHGDCIVGKNLNISGNLGNPRTSSAVEEPSLKHASVINTTLTNNTYDNMIKYFDTKCCVGECSSNNKDMTESPSSPNTHIVTNNLIVNETMIGDNILVENEFNMGNMVSIGNTCSADNMIVNGILTMDQQMFTKYILVGETLDVIKDVIVGDNLWIGGDLFVNDIYTQGTVVFEDQVIMNKHLSVNSLSVSKKAHFTQGAVKVDQLTFTTQISVRDHLDWFPTLPINTKNTYCHTLHVKDKTQINGSLVLDLPEMHERFFDFVTQNKHGQQLEGVQSIEHICNSIIKDNSVSNAIMIVDEQSVNLSDSFMQIHASDNPSQIEILQSDPLSHVFQESMLCLVVDQQTNPCLSHINFLHHTVNQNNQQGFFLDWRHSNTPKKSIISFGMGNVEINGHALNATFMFKNGATTFIPERTVWAYDRDSHLFVFDNSPQRSPASIRLGSIHWMNSSLMMHHATLPSVEKSFPNTICLENQDAISTPNLDCLKNKICTTCDVKDEDMINCCCIDQTSNQDTLSVIDQCVQNQTKYTQVESSFETNVVIPNQKDGTLWYDQDTKRLHLDNRGALALTSDLPTTVSNQQTFVLEYLNSDLHQVLPNSRFQVIRKGNMLFFRVLDGAGVRILRNPLESHVINVSTTSYTTFVNLASNPNIRNGAAPMAVLNQARGGISDNDNVAYMQVFTWNSNQFSLRFTIGRQGTAPIAGGSIIYFKSFQAIVECYD